MNEWGVITALAGVISTMAGLFYRDLKEQRDKCCVERDALREASDLALNRYRERDEEERKAWQPERQRFREETER